MIRLDRITLREIQLPLVEPFRTSAGEVAERRILLLELRDADGASAWSECVAQAEPSYSPDTVDTCWLAIGEWLAPRVLAGAIDGPESVHDQLSREIRGHHMARAAVEMGTWALAATMRDMPLAALLARASAVARERGAAPRPHVATGIALGVASSPEALVARARAAAADGYQRIKLKVGPVTAHAHVELVRSALGAGVKLSVDANSAFTLDDPGHVAMLESLDGFGLTMIEQPLAADDLSHHAALQRRLATPICLDESITSLERLDDMLALGSGRVVNLKPGRVGGFQQALAIHDRCAREGVAVWCGGMLECGIGRAYNVALASLPGFTEPGDLSPSARYWARDVVTPAWTMDADGRVRVPIEQAGLGVDVDTGFIDDLTVRIATFRGR